MLKPYKQRISPDTAYPQGGVVRSTAAKFSSIIGLADELDRESRQESAKNARNLLIEARALGEETALPPSNVYGNIKPTKAYEGTQGVTFSQIQKLQLTDDLNEYQKLFVRVYNDRIKKENISQNTSVIQSIANTSSGPEDYRETINKLSSKLFAKNVYDNNDSLRKNAFQTLSKTETGSSFLKDARYYESRLESRRLERNLAETRTHIEERIQNKLLGDNAEWRKTPADRKNMDEWVQGTIGKDLEDYKKAGGNSKELMNKAGDLIEDQLALDFIGGITNPEELLRISSNARKIIGKNKENWLLEPNDFPRIAKMLERAAITKIERLNEHDRYTSAIAKEKFANEMVRFYEKHAKNPKDIENLKKLKIELKNYVESVTKEKENKGMSYRTGAAYSNAVIEGIKFILKIEKQIGQIDDEDFSTLMIIKQYLRENGELNGENRQKFEEIKKRHLASLQDGEPLTESKKRKLVL